MHPLFFHLSSPVSLVNPNGSGMEEMPFHCHVLEHEDTK
jgi:FtsP/CotA-like multicopper oxidase with cupredoxin domain